MNSLVDRIKNLKVPYPTLPEQTAIANYLDNKTTKIDKLIANKQKQIELLKEMRQIEINNAVTKGLDPNVKMKDSGIEWLGEIPVHWEVKRLKYEIDFQEGLGLLATEFIEEGIPLVRISGVKTQTVSLEGCNYVDPEKVRNKWSHYILKEHDILISCSATTGESSEVPKELDGVVAYTGLIRLRPKRNSLIKDFIKLIVASDYYGTQIEQLKTGSTMQHYGPTHLNRMFLVLPPKEEQKNICQKANLKIGKIDHLLNNLETQITQLQEIRKIEIYNAVTGKIKVA